MTIAVVQCVGAFANSASSVTTSAITTTPGNLLHVDAFCYFSQANAMAVNDSKTNTWATAVAKHGAGGFTYAQSFYAKNINGGSSHTFTLSLGGSGYPTISVMEISGADTTAPLDLHEGVELNTSSQPAITTSGSTAQADEIAIGAFGTGGGANSVTEPSGWSTGYDNFGQTVEIHTSYKVLSATGAVTYNPSTSFNSTWNVQVTTYKAAGASNPTFTMAGNGAFSAAMAGLLGTSGTGAFSPVPASANPTFSMSGAGTAAPLAASLLAAGGTGLLNAAVASKLSAAGTGLFGAQAAAKFTSAGIGQFGSVSAGKFAMTGAGTLNAVPVATTFTFSMSGTGAANVKSAMKLSASGVGAFNPVKYSQAESFLMAGGATVVFVGSVFKWDQVAGSSNTWTQEAGSSSTWTPKVSSSSRWDRIH